MRLCWKINCKFELCDILNEPLVLKITFPEPEMNWPLPCFSCLVGPQALEPWASLPKTQTYSFFRNKSTWPLGHITESPQDSKEL